ncbi:hypothetical protein P4O66_007957 [Electrophorus voltai]|uniref:Thioredoxin domain-containing protein n=1 Tax=Electrophorus voltai TaxID=2609070 RepID=A0AAD8ZH02_9TELE|nr:hypothetical protein P4O66_007957 [Electrophorus voltai]
MKVGERPSGLRYASWSGCLAGIMLGLRGAASVGVLKPSKQARGCAYVRAVDLKRHSAGLFRKVSQRRFVPKRSGSGTDSWLFRSRQLAVPAWMCLENSGVGIYGRTSKHEGNWEEPKFKPADGCSSGSDVAHRFLLLIFCRQGPVTMDAQDFQSCPEKALVSFTEPLHCGLVRFKLRRALISSLQMKTCFTSEREASGTKKNRLIKLARFGRPRTAHAQPDVAAASWLLGIATVDIEEISKCTYSYRWDTPPLSVVPSSRWAGGSVCAHTEQSTCGSPSASSSEKPRVTSEVRGKPASKTKVMLVSMVQAMKVSPLVEQVRDHKDFKKLLRTRTNVLVLYTKSATSGDAQLKLLSDAAQAVKGQGTIAWVNCGDSEGRKLCKKVKVDPSSKTAAFEILHYKRARLGHSREQVHTSVDRHDWFREQVLTSVDRHDWFREQVLTSVDRHDWFREQVLTSVDRHDWFREQVLTSVDRHDWFREQVHTSVDRHDWFREQVHTSVDRHDWFREQVHTSVDRHDWFREQIHTSVDRHDWFREQIHTSVDRHDWFREQSMVAFLKDPTGAPLWEENPEAKDVTHIETEKDFRKLLKKEEKPVLVMFYAPWCGVCKRMQPIFQQAATDTKGKYVLAGMNVHPSEFDGLKQEFGIKGYPTFCYFEKGKFLHHYENYGATAKDIADWLKNPQPPQPNTPEVPWSESDSPVFHLTDESFDAFLEERQSVLVMFYAPCEFSASLPPARLTFSPHVNIGPSDSGPQDTFPSPYRPRSYRCRIDTAEESPVLGCGHCKRLKPEYDAAAEVANVEPNSPGVLAAVDATVHKSVAERFQVTSFPTVKYFERGEEKYTLQQLRTKDKILEWLKNPQAPPPPEQSWEEKPSSVSHLGAEDFRDTLKKKKHALVMFYAPWCPHCKNAVPHFTAAAELFKEDRKVGPSAAGAVSPDPAEVTTPDLPAFSPSVLTHARSPELSQGLRSETLHLWRPLPSHF